METRSVDFTFETRDDGSSRIVGHAIVFNKRSVLLREGGRTFTEIIAPTAVDTTLRAVESGEKRVRMLWAHDPKQQLGDTRSGRLQISKDETGLAFEFDPARLDERQLQAIKDGEVGMSFGFRASKGAITSADGGKTRTVNDMEFHEISFTFNPAYQDTSAAVREIEDFEREEEEKTVSQDEDSASTKPTKVIRTDLRRRLLNTITEN